MANSARIAKKTAKQYRNREKTKQKLERWSDYYAELKSFQVMVLQQLPISINFQAEKIL